ncbi:MAG: hypothetical protein HY364_01885 [Candidatus Aenigmarchaeota archaeon]|nr:hypothetical protein [Candidatus Aenigmarchaeota archaeon]
MYIPCLQYRAPEGPHKFAIGHSPVRGYPGNNSYTIFYNSPEGRKPIANMRAIRGYAGMPDVLEVEAIDSPFSVNIEAKHCWDLLPTGQKRILSMGEAVGISEWMDEKMLLVREIGHKTRV